MIKTPVSYEDLFSNIWDADGDIILYDVPDNIGCEIEKRINMHDELMRVLCDIQQMCIGDIAMGYKLEAETIGQLISAATGLTAPELMEKCK